LAGTEGPGLGQAGLAIGKEAEQLRVSGGGRSREWVGTLAGGRLPLPELAVVGGGGEASGCGVR